MEIEDSAQKVLLILKNLPLTKTFNLSMYESIPDFILMFIARFSVDICVCHLIKTDSESKRTPP